MSTSDEFAVRLSGLWQHRNDWIDNLDEPGDNDLEGYDDIALRGQIKLKPTEELTLRLIGQYRDLDGDARIFRANSFVTWQQRAGRRRRRRFRARRGPCRRPQFPGAQHPERRRGTIEYDFGPVTLYSVTSYWHGKLESRGDIDGGFGCTDVFCATGRQEPGLIPFTAQSQDNVPSLDQFTQEVRDRVEQ